MATHKGFGAGVDPTMWKAAPKIRLAPAAARCMCASAAKARANPAAVRSGVFIDADNVSPLCAERAIAAARDGGCFTLSFVRAYKDWNREPTDSRLVRACERNGIEQIHVSRASGKNSTDIRMCVDIVRLVHTTDVERFVLVTGDSDFRHVLMEIRGAGKVGCVCHCGPTKSRWLEAYADEYVLMDIHCEEKSA